MKTMACSKIASTINLMGGFWSEIGSNWYYRENNKKFPGLETGNRFFPVTDSKRSDECIDFTMLCYVVCFFFFVSVYTKRVEIMFQFQTLGVVFGRKLNLVVALGSFQKRREKPKKNKKLRKNRNFYAKLVFDQIDFFIWFVDKKYLDDQKILKI
ncbi:Uncharacterized protein FWK35_00009769 [Aphis craccivora]|uniref:Uncharacterized protein n=1 Tax=Aphis craccivora TaxID=307492 RepID=A0A6G0YHE8_APHCR|nr:Uncharacterized protein FWK35_00009769 [Aphis craccivora]